MSNAIWKADDKTALIIVDVTNDFCPPDGALMVQEGDQVIPVINALRAHFGKVVLTKEEHPAGHQFFASSHPGKKPLDTIETAFGTQYLWPDHCVVGTKGAEFHKDLIVKDSDVVVAKGTDPTIHAYSAFCMDDRKTVIVYEDGKTFSQKLKEMGVTRVVVTGLAYDFCVGMTAYDAAKAGFEAIVVADASRSIAIPVGEGRTTVDLIEEKFVEAGVKVVPSAEAAKVLGVKKSAPGLHKGPG